jgi:hypothetical protein
MRKSFLVYIPRSSSASKGEHLRRQFRLKRAEADIIAALSATGKRVYSQVDLRNALSRNRDIWELTRRISLEEFLEFLLRRNVIHAHHFRSEKYEQDITKYSFGRVSDYELALSIRAKSYLSHGTAAELHNLIKPNKRRIYINSEQSAKAPPAGSMEQASIDTAYARKQSTSGLIFQFQKREVVVLNGKQTGQLGVEMSASVPGGALRMTNLERTLVDIAVRPAYAGGAAAVLTAYRAARERASVDALIGILSKIGHRYPFHQAIGFLMSHSGYSDDQCAKLASLGLQHDFYVDYDIKNRAYSTDGESIIRAISSQIPEHRNQYLKMHGICYATRDRY